VRSLWARSFDILALKARYRYLIAAFLLCGLFAGGWSVVAWAHEAQLARGLTPGTPVGSEPGSTSFFLLLLALLLGGGLVGMALGAMALCLALTVLGSLTFPDSVRAVFLSHYPAHWFRR